MLVHLPFLKNLEWVTLTSIDIKTRAPNRYKSCTLMCWGQVHHLALRVSPHVCIVSAVLFIRKCSASDYWMNSGSLINNIFVVCVKNYVSHHNVRPIFRRISLTRDHRCFWKLQKYQSTNFMLLARNADERF